MENWWKDTEGKKKTEVLGGKPVPEPLSPSEIPYSLALNLNQAFRMINQRVKF
jgi:hypothetical protein